MQDSFLGQLIEEVRQSVGEMAGLVEASIQSTSKALAAKSPEALDGVAGLEEQINSFHINIDRALFKLLARQSPVASDLRMTLSLGRINIDLERMGDLSLSSALNVRDYLQASPILVAAEIPRMSDLIQIMVQKSLQAFFKKDQSIALEVLGLDDSADEFRDALCLELQKQMQAQSADVQGGLYLYNLVRNFERIGDHCTNIAEEVIFSVTGENVKHSIKPLPTQGDLHGPVF